MYSIARNGKLTPFLYYSHVYLRSLPNQLLDQQYHLIECMCGGCQETGAL